MSASNAAALLATGLIVGTMVGFPAGWRTYDALNVPAVSLVTTHPSNEQAHQLTKEIFWLNYAAKHRARTPERGSP